MVPFGESLNRRPRFIVNSWRSGPNKPLITLPYAWLSRWRSAAACPLERTVLSDFVRAGLN